MITVLMSTYNGEKYIREQIDSILNQENVEVQLLIRDDESTDNTINMLKEYEKSNNNVQWYAGSNLGCGKSFFQLVLGAPESDYYAFADQDDVWDPDKLAVAISNLESNTNSKPSLYCSTARPVDIDLNYLPQRKFSNIDLVLGISLTQAISPGCSYVFNYLLLEKFKKMKIDNIDIHDWALLRVVTAIDGYIFFDTEPHFSYRQHGNNVVGYQSSFLEHWIGRLKRFRNRDYRNIRHKMAIVLKNTYYEEMSEYNKILLDKFINYDLNIKSKWYLIKSNEIRMIKTTDNFIFKILILFCLV